MPAKTQRCEAEGCPPRPLPPTTLPRSQGKNLPIAHVAGDSAGCPQVAMLGVVGDHAVAAKSPGQRADTLHHSLDPGIRQSINVAVVESGDGLLLQRFVQRFGVSGIRLFIIDVTAALADREAIDSVVSLAPPSVQDAAIQSAIENDFLTTRPTRFQWSPRIVQPDINALDQVTTDVDVVVFHERNPAGEPRIVAKVGDLLNEAFAWFVFRMRFAGVDQLDWSIGVFQYLRDSISLAEQQVGSFVGRKPASKADC